MNRTHPLEWIIDVLVIAFVILFPHFAHLPYLSYTIVCFLVILIYIRTHKKKLIDFGLKRKGLSGHAVIVGIVSAIIWMIFIKLIYFPFINHFFKNYIQAYTEYDFVKNNILTLLVVILAAWIGGGFYEEFVFRGFMQKVMQKWFAKYRYRFWIAGFIVSVLFGLYHWQQGIFGVIPATMGGLYWTCILKRYDGVLWYPMISHAAYDTLALTMLYLGILN